MLRHATQDHQLLVIFLAKYCNHRLDAVEEFQDHGRDAGEKTRAKLTFENVAQAGRRGDPILLGHWIELVFVGREQNVNPFALQFLAIGLKGSRVLVEIFVGRELETVHKNRCHHRIAQTSRNSHQREVTLMQIAHGGHEGGPKLPAQLGPEFGHRSDDLH